MPKGDGFHMKFSFTSAALTVGALAALAAGMVGAAPAHADTSVDDVLSVLSDSGITNVDPATAVQLGQSICPLLAERGQNSADIASTVADALGKPLGMAPMFTGAAISSLCPGVVGNFAN